MADRYFVETPIGDSLRAELTDAEAQHLGKVMRAKPGDHVVLFDGSGCEFSATVASVTRQRIELEIVSRTAIDREPGRDITLAVALPKGERQRFLVEKLVELGATRLIPLETARGVAEAEAHVVQRLRRQVIEATKQCGRCVLMDVTAAQSLPSLIAGTSSSTKCVLAHPGGSPSQLHEHIAHVLCAIGPEGGFTDEEVIQARLAGWDVISLGQRILRVETAALTFAARMAMGK